MTAGEQIDRLAASLTDWRGETFTRVREIIHQADPAITEEWKWMGTPVFSHDGIVCVMNAFKDKVKLTFSEGASLPDPDNLFNNGLEGKKWRTIDYLEGDKVNEAALKKLVRAGVDFNHAKAQTKTPAVRRKPTKKPAIPSGSKDEPLKLLTGGNPQIAKADGDAPVQAYIAGMPGWKSDFGRRLDALIVRNVPNVRKAVKWNSPFYGIEGQGWFLSFHVFTRYVKVTFFRGTSLRPVPAGGTVGSKDARWVDIHEGDELDEGQMATWVKQAATLPGWVP